VQPVAELRPGEAGASLGVLHNGGLHRMAEREFCRKCTLMHADDRQTSDLSEHIIG
jgi:hypothetical protein